MPPTGFPSVPYSTRLARRVSPADRSPDPRRRRRPEPAAARGTAPAPATGGRARGGPSRPATGVTFTGGFPSRREAPDPRQDLETRIEQHRMEDVRPEVPGSGCGRGQLRQRLLLTRPDPAQAAERGAVRDPPGPKRPVHPGGLDGLQRLRKPLRIHRRLPHLRRPGGEPARRMPDPGLLLSGPAEHLPAPFAGVRPGTEHELHETAFVLILGQEERLIEARTPATRTVPVPGAARRRHRLGAIEGRGDDDAPEDAVVAEPRRVPGKEFRLVGDLAAPRDPPRSEQRVAGFATASPAPSHPVPLPLERIGRQGHPPPTLSGE